MGFFKPKLWRTLFLFTCLALASQSVFAREKFELTPVEACVLGDLRTYLEKDVSLRKRKLPDVITLRVNKSEATELFNTGANLWKSRWNEADIERLRNLAETAARTGSLDPDDVSELSNRRSDLKMLRYLFKGLSSSHEIPEPIDEVTTAIGKLRDAGDYQDPEEIRAAGNRVLKALKDKNLKAIDRAIEGFRPSNSDSFDTWLKKNVKEVNKILDSKKGRANDLHTVRKDLQAILTIYQVRMSIHPTDEYDAIYRRLVRETEYLGGDVDANEASAKTQGQDRKKFQVEYDPARIEEIRDFLGRLK